PLHALRVDVARPELRGGGGFGAEVAQRAPCTGAEVEDARAPPVERGRDRAQEGLVAPAADEVVVVPGDAADARLQVRWRQWERTGRSIRRARGLAQVCSSTIARVASTSFSICCTGASTPANCSSPRMRSQKRTFTHWS